jgi:carbamate kinase
MSTVVGETPRAGRAGAMSSALRLLVVALGGNAIAPPGGEASVAAERRVVAEAMAEIGGLVDTGSRLPVVHGNGPQIGRLLDAHGVNSVRDLDVHVAQSQGELGYLLADALDAAVDGEPTVALVTRVVVDTEDGAFARPTKPIGAVLPRPPSGLPSARTPDGSGWRRVVASPRPTAIVELEAIRALLATRHVVAGGGGGIALAPQGTQRRVGAAVVDKDRVATLLAIALDADRLVFVTDVAHAYDDFGAVHAKRIARMTVSEARERLARAVFTAGSMGPKVESAVAFAEKMGRAAIIAGLGKVRAALDGRAGTAIVPDNVYHDRATEPRVTGGVNP